MYLKHGEEGKEDRVGAEERGEEKNDVELEELELERREGGILGNRIDLGKLPVLLFFEVEVEGASRQIRCKCP